jgi:hypothetical protein
MVPPIPGVHELRSDPRLIRIAAIGALVAALGLVGCGRKAGLDPPPASAIEPGDGVLQPTAGPAVGPDGKPIAPSQGPRRSTPIDWLLN